MKPPRRRATSPQVAPGAETASTGPRLWWRAFFAFERATALWHGLDASERDQVRNVVTRNALDLADVVRELHELRSSGGHEAIEDLLGRARKRLAKVQASQRLSRKSDAGWILVAWTKQGLTDRKSSKWIAQKIARDLPGSVSEELKLKQKSWGAYRRPGAEPVEKGRRAIEKHRDSPTLLTDEELDRVARACVQHALEAFGLSASKAKIVAGLRKVPAEKRKRPARHG